MNKNQLNLAWKTSSHDERNQFINEFSIGSIDNSNTTSIELFKIENEILAMDHEDINEPHPFLTIPQITHFYEWTNNELLNQIKEYVKIHKSGNPIYPITNYFDPNFKPTPAFYSNHLTWKNWITNLHKTNEKAHKEFDYHLEMLLKLTNQTWNTNTF